MEQSLEEKHTHETLEVFARGKELNIGILPNTKVVKYGYSYIDNEFTLFLQGSDEAAEIIRNCIKDNKALHFHKWASDGKFITGYGNVKILESEKEMANGLKFISNQQADKNFELYINENDINKNYVFKVLVENTYLMKRLAD